MYDFNHSLNDSGLRGKALEQALKVYLHRKAIVSAPGRVDIRIDFKNMEVKTGAGELGNIGDRLVKGASMVCYVPVVNMNLSLDRQEGFILTRDAFLQVLEMAGLIREKTSTAGNRKVTIQTFWNHKKNAPHGKKYQVLLDLLYEYSTCTLDEWLDCH